MTRQNQRKQHLLKQINDMLESGRTQREVEQELGVAGHRSVHAGFLFGQGIYFV